MRTLYILFLLFCFISTNHAQFCSGNTILNECSGEFDDGSGNNNYSNNTDCTWLIQVEEDSTIFLAFNSFNTESCCDVLFIYDGPNSNAPLIGEYRGDISPDVILSSSNELFLEFTTDGSVTRAGWSVSYTCDVGSFVDLSYTDPGFTTLVSVDGTNLEYDFELLNNGNLESGPFEVSFYASNDSDIDISDVLLFTQTIDNMPASGALTLSGIQDIQDSIPPGFYNALGFIIDPLNEVDELAEGNNLHLENFVSFQIPYCSNLTTYTDCEGTFDDGSGTDEYANNTNCTWLIQVEEDSTILLTFNSFDTESCCDALFVYNGSSSNAPLIGEYRGSTLPDFIQSSSNELFLLFDSDGSVTNDGWSISYTCNDIEFVDLTYTDPQFTTIVSVSGTVLDYEFELLNNGNLESGPFEVSFYASDDSNIDVSDVLLYTEIIDNIPANDALTVSGMHDIQDSIPPGSYNTLGFIIDPLNEVEELMEENNLYIENFASINIPYCSDLTTIVGCQGTIEDGSGAEDVIRETQCSWLIESENNESIMLDFFDVELFSSDVIRIYNGDDANAPLIHVFRGDDDFYPVISDGNSIFFEFDVAFTGDEGWNATYSCTDVSAVNMIMDPSSFAFSTGSVIEFDLDIRNNGNSASPASKVYFYGSTDNSFNITQDVLIDSIDLGSIPAFGEVSLNHVVNASGLLPSGEYQPIAVIDVFNNVDELNEEDNIEIFSNQFTIPFCSDTVTLIDDCFGSFSDGSGNLDYSDNSDCKWLIQGSTGSNIRITFNEFETESCCDFIYIYDGSNSSAPLLGTYSGTSLPPVIQTTQPKAYIEFETDGSVSDPGWEIEYECIEFFSDLQFKNGTTQFQVVDNLLTFSSIIENAGVLPSGDFELGFILSEDEVPNIGDFIIKTKTMNSLESGEEVADETEVFVGNLDIPTAEYFLIVRLDIGEVIEENDETNNDYISIFPIDIINNTEDLFEEAELMVFIQNNDLLIKNDLQHHLKRISLVKSDGVVLQDQNIDNTNSVHKLDVIDYPTGLYFVRIELEDQILVKKLFIY